MLTPVRLLLMAEAIGEAPRERDQSAEDVLCHRNAMDAACIRYFDPAFAKLGVHELTDAGSRRVEPFQFSRELELFGAKRKADEDVRVGQFFCEPVIFWQVDDAHFGPARADALRHFCRRVPKLEGVRHADEEFGL